tara:strand:- start:81 stop:551 length:471 start_codon:yes stop_codon:yes gene_type:complete
MVHRIQNRNPGYSDFSNLGPTASFNFSSNNATTPVSHGANALKLDNEVVSENFNESVDDVNHQYNEELLKNQEAENIVENVSEQEEVSFSQEAIATPETDQTSSNNLKEFGVEEDGPDLFSSENQNSTSDDLLGSTNDNQDDDDLEIPAFLRRQKN